jgi:hypothetical protein
MIEDRPGTTPPALTCSWRDCEDRASMASVAEPVTDPTYVPGNAVAVPQCARHMRLFAFAMKNPDQLRVRWEPTDGPPTSLWVDAP